MRFNKNRQQLLTADRSCLRLWSLRKELKRINLIPNPSSSNEGDDNDPTREALVVSLIHAERRDLYICVLVVIHEQKGQTTLSTQLW